VLDARMKILDHPRVVVSELSVVICIPVDVIEDFGSGVQGDPHGSMLTPLSIRVRDSQGSVSFPNTGVFKKFWSSSTVVRMLFSVC